METPRYFYYPDLSIWHSVDPLSDKYPNLTPYAYCVNNPVILGAPAGKEGIVVSSSPGKQQNKLHFLINGLDRAKAAQKRIKKGEGTTWIIYNDKENGFYQTDIDKYKKEANDASINVKIVSEVDEIVDYINNKTGGNSRNKDKISSFYYVGHSTVSNLDVGYQGSGQKFDPRDLKSSTFKSGTWVNVVGGCNTAVDRKILGFIPIKKSVIRQFADILDEKSIIHGSNVRVYYPGGIAREQKLLGKNKGKIITINGKRR
ncbi:MAG TPA: hypothetical protein GXZ40_06735 [Bacteroidales bacterium]|jgi:hypothetical protein|nr:hypothetical protein [Bacteroidales bacterium]